MDLLDDLFRREAARLVAALTRALVGGELRLATDVLRGAMLTGLQGGLARGGSPAPGGWLIRAVKTRALDALRRRCAD